MKLKFTAFCLTGVLIAAQTSFAHEIVLTPSISGNTLTMAIESTHRFVRPEELEDIANLQATLVTPAGTEALTITQAGDLSLQAVTPTQAGYFVVHRLPLVYSSTPDGFKPGGKAENPDAAFSNRYEKYSKALLPGVDATFAMTPLGHALELVPLSDPAALAAGDTLKVQVLHDGKPVAATVQATFAGFSDVPMTFAYQTETGDEFGTPGLAEVKLWQPGYWYIRVALDGVDADPEIDTHVLRAILSFDVK